MEFQFQNGARVEHGMDRTHDLAAAKPEVVHGTCRSAVPGAGHRKFDSIPGLLAQFGFFPFPLGLSGEWLHIGKKFLVTVSESFSRRLCGNGGNVN